MHFTEIINQLPQLKIFKDNTYNIQISYRYQKFNEEIPILFLHGFNGNSKSWAYQFHYFKGIRSVIAIDAPGFGQSDSSDLDMLSISNIVYNLLKSIDVKKCDLVGHSMGGMLSQIIASQHNNLVNKVILSCTHKGYAFPKGSPLKEAYRLRLEQRKKMSDKDKKPYLEKAEKDKLRYQKEMAEIIIFWTENPIFGFAFIKQGGLRTGL